MKRNTRAKKLPENELRHKHFTERKTVKELSQQYNCSPGTILRYFKKYGIEARTDIINIPREELEEHIKNNKTNQEIAKIYDCHEGVIHKRMLDFNLVEIDMSRPPKFDLINQKFNMLTVKSYEGRDDHGAFLWKCSCDCGGSIVAKDRPLRYGTTKTCGCSKRGSFNRVISKEGFICNAMFNAIKNRRKRGQKLLEFTITIRQLETLPHDECCYCKTKLTFPQSSEDFTSHNFNASLDRIDSSKGYVIENCRWTCYVCNIMKLDWTEEFFMNHMKKCVKVMEENESEKILEAIRQHTCK